MQKWEAEQSNSTQSYTGMYCIEFGSEFHI